MNDSEARYLIDQFNRYASWSTRQTGMISVAPLSLAIFALGWSVATFGRTTLNLWDDVMLCLVLGAVIFMVAFVLREHRRITYEHLRNRECLIALEGHRVRFKSLPEISLAEIVNPKFTVERLKKFLRENEPSPKASPQT